MKTLTLLLLAVVLVSCENNDAIKHKPFYIGLHNGHGWSETFNSVECDSFKMITPFECKAYYNGTEMTLKAELITPQSN